MSRKGRRRRKDRKGRKSRKTQERKKDKNFKRTQKRKEPKDMKEIHKRLKSKRKLQDIGVIVVAVIFVMAVLISYYTFSNNVEENDNDLGELSGTNNPSKKSLNEYKYSKASTGLPNSGDYNYLDLGDVDNDNDLDIVAGTGGWPASIYGLHLYLNDGSSSWTNSDSGLPTTGTYGCVRLVDINKDGNLDIFASHEKYGRSEGRGIVIYLGDGKGGWQTGNSPSIQNFIAEFVVKDINKDGHLDIAAATQEVGVKVWLGNGGNSWTDSSSGLPTTNEFTGIALGDINGDSNLDIATATYVIGGGGRGVHVYRNKGDGSWEDKSENINSMTYEKGRGGGMGIELVDFNKDGTLDLIYNSCNSGIQTYTGNGNFVWSLVTKGIQSNGYFMMVDCRDVDSDGNLDIVSGTNGGGVHIYSWIGDGWNQISDNGLPKTGACYTPTLGDIDSDGDLDIVCATIRDGIKAWKAG
jgi:hypothetical protein